MNQPLAAFSTAIIAMGVGTGLAETKVGTNVDSHSIRQPLGVCAGITPFNFPAMVPMWMFPMAIACGNTFVLKTSERVPSTALRLAELFSEAGLPPGVLNVINGDKEAVDTLLTHPDVAAISFVGSTAVAEYVYQTGTRHGKRVQALGGAKNHMVVMPDADLLTTARRIVWGKFTNAGQTCIAPDYVLTDAATEEKLVPLLQQAVTEMFGEDPQRSDSYGRIVKDAEGRVLRIVEAEWVAVLRDHETVHCVGEAPSSDWLQACLAGSGARTRAPLVLAKRAFDHSTGPKSRNQGI